MLLSVNGADGLKLIRATDRLDRVHSRFLQQVSPDPAAAGLLLQEVQVQVQMQEKVQA